jgi:hypothetical protein
MSEPSHPHAHSESQKEHARSPAESKSQEEHALFEPDSSELELDKGDEDVFEGYFLSKAGINLNYLLFPGLIAHEFAHYLACKLAGIRVYEVVFWSSKGGHVVHNRAKGANAVLISLAPFFLNNILAILAFASAFGLWASNQGLWAAVLFWLGFSFGVYAVPSAHDLRMSLAALHRSFRKTWYSGSLASKLVGIVVYPVWFVLQYTLVLAIMPISKVRTLRIGWAILVLLVAAGLGTTLV